MNSYRPRLDKISRTPGRPSRTECREADSKISRDAIHERVAEIAMRAPFEDISVSSLAKDFGVTPALIHYYAGSLDDIKSSLIKRYFKDRMDRLGQPSGVWRQDLEHHALITYEVSHKYRGVLRYFYSDKNSELLKKARVEGGVDVGFLYLNRISEIFQNGGFSPEYSALGYRLLSHFVRSWAFATANGFDAVGNYITQRIHETSAAEYPAAHFSGEAHANLTADRAFREGLKILLDGMERWPTHSACVKN